MQREISPSEALCHALNQINQTARWDARILRDISANRSRLHKAHTDWLEYAANQPGISPAEAMRLIETPFEGRPLAPDQLRNVLARFQQIETFIAAARAAALADGASVLDTDEHKTATVDIIHRLRVADRLVSGLQHTLQMPRALCAEEADQLEAFGDWCGTTLDRLSSAVEVQAFEQMRKGSAPDLLSLRTQRSERKKMLGRLRTTIHRAHVSHRALFEEAGRYWDSQCHDALERSMAPDETNPREVAVIKATVDLESNPPDYTALTEQDRLVWAARVAVLAWVLMDPDAGKSPIQLTVLQQEEWTGEQGYDPTQRPQEVNEYVPLHVIADALEALDVLLDRAETSQIDTSDQESPPPPEGASGANEISMIRAGNAWTLEFRGQSIPVAHRVGLQYIEMLIARPGNPIAATELRRVASGITLPVSAGSEVSDDEAVRRYEAEFAELQTELAAARRDNNTVEIDSIRAQMEQIAHQLTQARGLGGRKRRMGSDKERARTAVRNNIVAAVKAIEKDHPDLANHLSQCIVFGTTLVYDPARHNGDPGSR